MKVNNMKTSATTIIKAIMLIVFTLISITNTSCVQPKIGTIKTINTSDKVDKIHELMSKYAEYGQFNGTILVAEKGEILYKKGFGLANMEWDIPNETDTKFRLASVTKQFTAMLIVQLAAENKLDLNKPISTYLPDYPKETGDQITIHQLLIHTSGIPNYTSFPSYRDLERDAIQPEGIVRLFADSTLLFTPGEKHKYSNSGYALLGVIIEKITGKSFEEVLQEKIFTPLKMKNSGYDNPPNKLIKNRALGYYKNGQKFRNASYINMSIAYAAGGIYSTVEDLYLWDQALYTEQLAPKKYMDLIFEKHVPFYGRHYGYGWEIGEMAKGNTRERVQAVNHSGVVNGFNTLITRVPADKSSIILLNNTGNADLYRMSRAISGILYDKPYKMPKKSTAHAMLDVIKKEGLEKGFSFYEKVKDSELYNLDENELNLVGYEFLQANKLEEAAAIFKLNLEVFPTSANVYDSYGEVLLLLGKKEEAIKNYRISVLRNPRNDNGIKVLKGLGEKIPKRADLLFFETEDKTWRKEIFIFPIRFAREIAYEGVEDARFPVGWEVADSSTYWSYSFGWNISHEGQLTKEELEVDLQMYFDGLMRVDSTTVLLKGNENATDKFSYTGQVKTINTFFRQRSAMTLNTTIEQYYCEEKKKLMVHFKFSPKAFGHDVWEHLEEVKFPVEICDL